MAETEYDLFLSFARNSAEADSISDLAFRLQREVYGVGLKNVHIWVDRSEDPAAEAWERACAGENDGSAVLLAFITPAWFSDPLCRLEAQLFQSFERQLGRKDLILPVRFLPTRDIEFPRTSAHPKLAADLVSRWLLRVDDMAAEEANGFRGSAERLALLLKGQLGQQDREPARYGQATYGKSSFGRARLGQARWRSAEELNEEKAAKPRLEEPQLRAPDLPREDLRALSVEEGATKIEEWFLRNYEPPEMGTPRNDGEYNYIWGGPYETIDVIEQYFDDVATWEQMERAALELDRYSFEWAPHGARIRPSDDDTWQNRQTKWEEETRPWNDERFSAAKAHQDMLQRIEQLEAALEKIGQGPAGMGHNQPPEPIPDELPITRAEFEQLSHDVAHLKSLPAQPDRDQLTEVKAIQDRTESLGRRIAGWILKKADRFVDATVIVAGTKAGSEILGIAPALLEVGQTIWTWLTTLGWRL
ncbi:TIR domain-containing protein [Minwuia thermotolerans]|nr:TIR domain-containing protein [Minwuia thermotolerans]